MNYEDFKKQKRGKVRFETDITTDCGMTENEKNLALGLAKVKVDKLLDWYYIKRSPLLKDFDKEALLGKIIFDLQELRSILDGCKYNPSDEQAKVMNEADKREEALQNERELNPDAFTKEVSAENQALLDAAKHYSERTRFHWPNQVRPAYDAFIAGAKWQEEYWDKVMRDNHVDLL